MRRHRFTEVEEKNKTRQVFRCEYTGKICHLSFRHAARYVRKLGEIVRRSVGHKAGFHPYFCKHCDHWHLGSQK